MEIKPINPYLPINPTSAEDMRELVKFAAAGLVAVVVILAASWGWAK